MVVELGGEIFKREDNVRTWMEINLPNTYPFGVFIDVYVIMELALVGYTNVQAQTMEQNMKLKLEADIALVIKTFENKLPSLFGLKVGEGNAYCLVISTKDSWLPGFTNYTQWETSNCLGGMKVVLNEQLGTVEHQVRDSIRMNLAGHSKAQSIATSYLETSVGFLNTVSNYISDTYQDLSSSDFPAQITWQLVSKLVYQ
eukprot:15293839-Ditylum_brightwellii.AAC.1